MAERSWTQPELTVKETLLKNFADVNRELWLVLSLFGLAALINFLISSHAVMLNFYVLPTIFSAYFYGRRHAVSTALASVLLIVLLAYWNSNLFSANAFALEGERWYSVIAWANGVTSNRSKGQIPAYLHVVTLRTVLPPPPFAGSPTALSRRMIVGVSSIFTSWNWRS